MPRANKKAGKGSSTPGRSKGSNCHRSPLKNLYSKDTRVYKRDPKQFLAACEEVSNMKGNHPTQEVLAAKRGELLG